MHGYRFGRDAHCDDHGHRDADPYDYSDHHNYGGTAEHDPAEHECADHNKYERCYRSTAL